MNDKGLSNARRFALFVYDQTCRSDGNDKHDKRGRFAPKGMSGGFNFSDDFLKANGFKDSNLNKSIAIGLDRGKILSERGTRNTRKKTEHRPGAYKDSGGLGHDPKAAKEYTKALNGFKTVTGQTITKVSTHAAYRMDERGFTIDDVKLDLTEGATYAGNKAHPLATNYHYEGDRITVDPNGVIVTAAIAGDLR